jgi:hypothetical protein
MKLRYLFFVFGLVLLLTAPAHALAESKEAVTNARHFIHEVTSSNLLEANITVLSHPLTNSNPTVLVYAVQNQFAPGSRDVVGAHIAVRYNPEINRWMLVMYGGTSTNLKTGVTFVVYVAEGDSQHWVHVDSNPNGASTKINHPDINGHPGASILFTPRYHFEKNPPVALRYFEADSSWYIVAQDGEPLPDGVVYNLRVITDVNKAFKIFAVGGQVINDGQSVMIDHPSLNNQPDALFWYAPQEVDTQVDFATALQYRAELGRWVIVRLNIGDINGAGFNIQLGADYSVLGEEILSNGSFEASALNNEQVPALWVGKSLVKTKRVCNKPLKAKFFSATGDCAVSFKGVAGAKSSLKNTASYYPFPVEEASVFTLRAFVSGKNLTGGVKVQAKLQMDTGDNVKISLDPADIHDGTYAYKSVSITSPLTLHPVVKASVKVQMNNGSGTLLIDDVSLYYNEVALSTSLLSLPVQP